MIRSKLRKGRKQRDVGKFHTIQRFEEVLNLADADFSENTKNASTPTWKEGAKSVDPYLVWSYTKTVCNSRKTRMKNGT